MNELTSRDKRDLETHETIIEKSIASAFDLAASLTVIRNRQLYLESHKTFESYCSSRWGFSKSRAYQLLSACEDRQLLSTVVDTDDIVGGVNERQLREVATLETEQQKADVMAKAVEIAPRNKDDKIKLTAAVMKKARNEVIGEPNSNGRAPKKKSKAQRDTEEIERQGSTKLDRSRDMLSSLKQYHGDVCRLIGDLGEVTRHRDKEAAIKACHEWLRLVKEMAKSLERSSKG